MKRLFLLLSLCLLLVVACSVEVVLQNSATNNGTDQSHCFEIHEQDELVTSATTADCEHIGTDNAADSNCANCPTDSCVEEDKFRDGSCSRNTSNTHPCLTETAQPNKKPTMLARHAQSALRLVILQIRTATKRMWSKLPTNFQHQLLPYLIQTRGVLKTVLQLSLMPWLSMTGDALVALGHSLRFINRELEALFQQ